MPESKDRPQIPTQGDVIGPAKDALIKARPAAAPYVESGRYGDVFVGWRAQFEVARKRLVDEVLASRSKTATGQALTDVAAGQYDTDRIVQERTAIGEATATRSVVHYTVDAVNVFTFATQITTPDASDIATWQDLLVAVFAAMTTHQASVYSTTTGIGAHVLADPMTWPTIIIGSMTDVVTLTNTWKARVNTHLQNTTFHKNADTKNVITASDAFKEIKSGGIDTWNDATTASQQSVLQLLNATKRAANAHFLVEAKAGVVRRGHRVAVEANDAANPPIVGGEFTAVLDTPVQTGADSVIFPIQATKPGSSSNQPALDVDQRTLTSRDPFYDAGASYALSLTALRAAGGAGQQTDDELLRAAKAGWKGRNAPVNDALVTGALADAGASKTVVRDDTATGAVLVYPVDPSWAQSEAWNGAVAQTLANSWLGFGCRQNIGAVTNKVIRLELTVRLVDAKHLSDTTAIQRAVQRVAHAYFDDRPDWYTWRLAGIRAVVARADRRILTCSVARVLDRNGVPLSEPPATVTGGMTLTHYWLTDQAISVTFTAPA